MTAIFLAGFCLGVAAFWVSLESISLAARRHVAPTKRDLPEVHNVPPMPECRPAREEKVVEPLYMYGVTGEER